MRPPPVQWALYLRVLSNVEGVFHLNPEVSDGALELGVPEEELDGSQVFGSLVDQSGFCAPQRMRAVHRGVQPDVGYPRRNKASILPALDSTHLHRETIAPRTRPPLPGRRLTTLNECGLVQCSMPGPLSTRWSAFGASTPWYESGRFAA